MEITLLWESSAEEQLKETAVLGRSAWSYTESLFQAVQGEYRTPNQEDYQLLSKIRENRSFSVQEQFIPKRPVLYFVGHYPSLPKEVFLEFIAAAQDAGLAVLSMPSAIWAGEKEILCLWYHPQKQAEQIEKTLAFPLTRLTKQSSVSLLEMELVRFHNLERIKHGVQIQDIASTWIDPAAEIAGGVEILAGTRILGKTRIAEGCRIGPHCQIRDSKIGKDNTIVQSQIENSTIKDACNIGPFSYIRPDSVIGSRVRIGDFVEIKNSVIGEDTMISHLTYVGDADVGKRVNFGCGTILVNFDGIAKHRSSVEDDAFIGCNSNLVSPVHIGKGAFVAAGSTITKDLPTESLGIARVRQQIKENWVTNRKTIVEGGKTNEQS